MLFTSKRNITICQPDAILVVVVVGVVIWFPVQVPIVSSFCLSSIVTSLADDHRFPISDLWFYYHRFEHWTNETLLRTESGMSELGQNVTSIGNRITKIVNGKY